MNLLGGVSAGGIERRKVVDVPSDRITSPWAERAITDAGLSPVNGAILHSAVVRINVAQDVRYDKHAWVETPSFDEPFIYLSEKCTSDYRFRAQLGAQVRSAASFE